MSNYSTLVLQDCLVLRSTSKMKFLIRFQIKSNMGTNVEIPDLAAVSWFILFEIFQEKFIWRIFSITVWREKQSCCVGNLLGNWTWICFSHEIIYMPSHTLLTNVLQVLYITIKCIVLTTCKYFTRFRNTLFYKYLLFIIFRLLSVFSYLCLLVYNILISWNFM